VYLGQAELANGYHELGDATEQLQRFERENRLTSLRGGEATAVDYRLIEALRHGLPECSGVALGVDRLLMRILDLDSIDAVLAFPDERA
jgi:lysyl-tRNA synthetase class 2